MKRTRFAIAMLTLLLLSGGLNAQDVYSKIRVYYDTANTASLNNIIGLLEIDHFVPENGAIVSEVNAALLPLLRQQNLRYEVLVDDIAKNITKLNKDYFDKRAAGRVALEQTGGVANTMVPTPAVFQVKTTFGGYYNFAEMSAAMDSLVATYPNLAQKFSLGKTYQGRDIWCVKIAPVLASGTTDSASVASSANGPELLYIGLQHAREAITGSSMIFFMQYLCENYAKDRRIQSLVNNRQIYIIPCSNPDGWEYNRTSMSGSVGGGWRKNRSPQGTNFGVDLNRNWGVDWGNCKAPILGPASSCGTSSTSSDTYYGTKAFSELETQAIRTLVQAHHFVAALDQHCYGPYYSIPYGRKSLHTAGLPVKGQHFFTAIPAIMGMYNGMRSGDSYDALGYEVAGGFKDWMLMGDIGTGTKDTVYALTGEGGTGNGTAGTYGEFWAPASQIIQLCKGMCYQNLQLAYAAGSYVDIQDTNDIALAGTTGSLGFRLQRLGLGDAPVTVTLVPLENIKTASPSVVVSGISNYYNTYSGSIPYTLPAGITSGQRIRFVWKVSTGGYTYADTITKFYNPVVLFADNMEGTFATNWTATSNVTDKWAYTTLAAYGGTHSMTESPAGNYTKSTTRTVTYKNSLSLTGAKAAFLAFWVKHRAENFRDKLQVQVSSNGGTSWTAIAGSTTVQEPGTTDGSTINGVPSLTGIRDYWTKELFDLNAYRGTTIKLRFVFTSDADGTTFKYQLDDGFYIDNIKVVSTTATLVNLVDTSMAARLANTNGGNTNLLPGISQLLVYPNPARETLVVKFYDNHAPETLELELTDVQGRVVYRQLRQSLTGDNEIRLPVRSLVPQLYLLKITGRQGQEVYISKFIKQ